MFTSRWNFRQQLTTTRQSPPPATDTTTGGNSPCHLPYPLPHTPQHEYKIRETLRAELQIVTTFPCSFPDLSLLLPKLHSIQISVQR